MDAFVVDRVLIDGSRPLSDGLVFSLMIFLLDSFSRYKTRRRGWRSSRPHSRGWAFSFSPRSRRRVTPRTCRAFDSLTAFFLDLILVDGPL